MVGLNVRSAGDTRVGASASGLAEALSKSKAEFMNLSASTSYWPSMTASSVPKVKVALPSSHSVFASGTSVISKSPTKGPLEEALLAVRLDDAEEDEESR